MVTNGLNKRVTLSRKATGRWLSGPALHGPKVVKKENALTIQRGGEWERVLDCCKCKVRANR